MFPRAAITKQHKVGVGEGAGLQQQKPIVLQSWRLGVGSRCPQGGVLLRAGREHPSPASPLASGGFLVIFGVSWLAGHIHLHVMSSLFVSTFSLFIRTPVILD